MKRLLCAVAAIAVAGTFAFADDAAAPAAAAAAPTITWNVSTYNGFGVVTDSSASSTTVQQYSYDWQGLGAYRFQAAYNAADGNSGFQLRLQTKDQTGTSPAFNEFWGYGKFFNGLVKVEAGLLNDYAISTGGWETYGNSDNGKVGFQVDVTPADGLTIGLYAPVFTYDKTTTNTDSINSYFVGSQIGVAYEAKDLFHVVGGYYLGDSATIGTIYGGFALEAVKDLSFNVEVKVADIGQSSSGTTNIEEYVAYPIGDLTLSAYAGEWLYATDTSNFYFNVEPQVAYKVSDAVKVALIGNVYSYNGGSAAMSFVSPVDGVSDLSSSSAGSPVIAYGAGPNVQLKAGGSKVTIGDYYGAIPAFAGADSKQVNVLYTSYTYSF